HSLAQCHRKKKHLKSERHSIHVTFANGCSITSHQFKSDSNVSQRHGEIALSSSDTMSTSSSVVSTNSLSSPKVLLAYRAAIFGRSPTDLSIELPSSSVTKKRASVSFANHRFFNQDNVNEETPMIKTSVENKMN